MSDIPTYHKGQRNYGTGYDMMQRIDDLEASLSEMTRRRDEWRKKSDGYDDVRIALREKVGAPWPPNLSRLLWAGIAADQKKTADDLRAALREILMEATSRNHALDIARRALHGDKLQK
jgi:hypothetical protein